jgi:hypothetical protein
MMAFITRCCKNVWFERARNALAALMLVLFASIGHAQNVTEIVQFQVERVDEEVIISAQMGFELPVAVEDALLKGIPLFFVIEADVMRERWYWYDKKISSVERHMRLAYQPLTRRWRLNVTAGAGRDNGVGLALNQSFDTLPDVLSAIKRISRWKIADVTELDTSQKYKVDFRFRLDLNQLPRPFQIGALGQSEWDIAAATSSVLAISAPK